MLWLALLCVGCLALLSPAQAVSPAPVKIPSGVRSLLWKSTFKDGLSNILLLDDVLVITHGKRVEGRNAVTGTVVWAFDTSTVGQFTPPEEAIAATGDIVSVSAPLGSKDEDVEGDGNVLFAFNGRVGRGLWALASGAPGEGLPHPFFSLVGAGGGRIVISVPAISAIRGLDAADGARRWDSLLTPGCAFEAGDADDRVTGVLMRCGKRWRLRALDSGSGAPLWEHSVFPLGNPLVEVDGGAVGLESDNAFDLFDTSGRRLYQHIGETICSCSFVATSDTVVLARFEDATTDALLEILDRSSGRVVLTRKDARSYTMFGTSGGRPYWGEDRAHGGVLIQTLGPEGVVTPVVAFPDGDPHAMNDQAFLVVTGDDSPQLNAYGLGLPAEPEPGVVARGGVARAAWPDACALLPTSVLARELPGVHFRAVPRRAAPELGLNTPVGCDLLPEVQGGRPTISVDVVWVGTTPGEAKELLANMPYASPKKLAPAPADQLLTDEQLTDTIALRVGSAVVRIDGAGDRDLTVRLARLAARSLRELPP
ncbi:outer membrane protein assembly factor BamB family protein [Nonomuraea sp. NPDC001699]